MTRRVDPTESQLPMVRESDQTAIVPHGEPSIGAILALAVEKGVPPEVMEKLVDLHERTSDRAAAREFAAAMAEFQATCPPIAKTSHAEIVTKAGGRYGYTYAELDEIARTVRPLLHKLGLSYSWDSADDGGKVVVTCIIRHANGHSQSAKFSCPTDSAAAMSGAQKQAAALTYARRQSLIQALGLTTCDPDMDGADVPRDVPKITDHQAANIEALLAELGPLRADRAKFLAWVPAPSIAEIPASEFKRCVAALEKKRGGAE